MIDRLEEIKQRLENATPGPWIAQNGGEGDDTSIWFVSTKDSQPKTWQAVAECGFSLPFSNADFIAHAREDIPFLLAEIERLKTDLNYQRQYADEKWQNHQMTTAVEAFKAEVERLKREGCSE